MRRLEITKCRGRRHMFGAPFGVTSKLRFAMLLAAAVVMLQGVDAQADMMDGSVEFFPPFVANSPTISGGFSMILGGTATTPGLFDATGLSSGANPQLGSLTQVGDGIFFESHVSNTGSVSGPDFDIDGLGFIPRIQINASSNPFSIDFQLDITTHTADAGDDGFISSGFTLEQDSAEIFYTELFSDAVAGDEKNRDFSLGTFGAPLSDSPRSHSFTIALNPGDSPVVLEGLFGLTAGAYELETSTFTGDFDAQLIVTGITETVVPVPSAMLLASIGMGSSGLIIFRRRRHCA